MRSLQAVLLLGMMVLLAGCALLAEDVPESPAVAPVPEPALAVPVPPPYAETELPTSRAPVLVLPPTGKVVHAASSAPASKTNSVAGLRPQEPPAAKTVERAQPPAKSSPQLVRGAAKEPAKDKSLPGPTWLKACQHRQQQGDVIMCDADSLLVQPSDKVMVYVRDVKLTRKASAGQSIVLRESLPRLYRIFVLE